jgi:hypothetical protein
LPSVTSPLGLAAMPCGTHSCDPPRAHELIKGLIGVCLHPPHFGFRSPFDAIDRSELPLTLVHDSFRVPVLRSVVPSVMSSLSHLIPVLRCDVPPLSKDDQY